jgi:hypothetical protein
MIYLINYDTYQNPNIYYRTITEQKRKPNGNQTETKRKRTIKEKKENKENIYSDNINTVFEFWNSKNIIVHRKLTDQIKSSINSKLKDYSVDEICDAINNYSLIISMSQFYFTYRWPLATFLKRGNGFESFLSYNKPFHNYLDTKKWTEGELERWLAQRSRPQQVWTGDEDAESVGDIITKSLGEKNDS